MLETILIFVLASVLGIVVGLFPGINIFIMLTLLYPLLTILEPVNIIMVYVVLSSISQFFGSVSATLFAIPGESTSLPSLYEGHELYRNNQGDKAIMYASLGSFFGSVFSVVLVLILMNFIFVFYNFFDTRVIGFILLIAVLSFIFTGKNKALVNVLFLGIGLFLGHIGYDGRTEETFMTFGNIYLFSGLPMLSVILGIYVIPYILKNLRSEMSSIEFKKLSFNGYFESAKEMISYKYVLLRSSMIGFLSGFLPGISYQAGTAIAYFLEKNRKERNKTYKEGDLDCLVAAETANNAGTFTIIIPLLLISIPITASQALLYNLIGDQGALLTVSFFRDMFLHILIAYLLSSIVGLYLAGKYVNWIAIVTRVNLKYLYVGILAVLMILTYIAGAANFQAWYWIIMLIILVPFGYLLRNFDTLPIVLGFLLHDQIYSTIVRLYFLYF